MTDKLRKKGRPNLGKDVTRFTIALDQKDKGFLCDIALKNGCSGMADAIRLIICQHSTRLAHEESLKIMIDISKLEFLVKYVNLMGEISLNELVSVLQRAEANGSFNQ
jgi:hypothetical protein